MITIDISSSWLIAISFNFVFVFLSSLLLFTAYVLRNEKILAFIPLILGIFLMGVVIAIDLDAMGILYIRMVN